MHHFVEFFGEKSRIRRFYDDWEVISFTLNTVQSHE